MNDTSEMKDVFQTYLSSMDDLTRVCAVPDSHSKVWKDECMFCYCDSECDGGLYINMKTFQGFCSKHLALDQEKHPGALYLIEKTTKTPKNVVQEEKTKVDKMAIGVPGGFDVSDGQEFDISKDHVIFASSLDARLGLDREVLPDLVIASAEAIKGHESVSNQTSLESWEEERKISKYAESLELLPCNRKVPMDPKEWKCDETGVTDNLWLNLSTGHIGSGRPQWDGTGGNGAAMRHYESTGKKYPLVVKLGTITPGGADVYSYASDEDDMVLDPKLGDHLAHWGINMMKMEKTDKTVAELQIERNLSFEFDAITEAGATLEPLSGKGFVGLKNLGNSCYINSTLQLLWNLPELQEKYLSREETLYKSSQSNPAYDFITQFTKVGAALASDSQGCLANPKQCVSPWMLKKLCGMRHPEFATCQQQDAQEFLSFLIDQVAREEHGNKDRIGDANFENNFKMGLQTRIQCQESHRTSYKSEQSTCLSLEIPIDSAINAHEVETHLRDIKRQKKSDDVVLPKIALKSCFERLAEPEELTDYFSACLNKRTKAIKTVKIDKFPKYLILHMRRYYVDETWTPKKLDVKLDVPEQLSLEEFRAHEPKADELLQPEEPSDDVNSDLLQQLVAMGFDASQSKNALLSTGNSDINAAMEFILTNGTAEGDFSEESTQSLVSMGFTAEQAKEALKQCDGNVERAVDWLFSHPNGVEHTLNGDSSNVSDYELCGFVSHIGKNTSSGHYVCHLKKDGMWVIYNDEKVAKSENPPTEFGYMYLYKQKK
ncbi:hypothetical protein M9434_005181 [Picochlorum sp. BPE23]|nr:hypothetical protein M9434_005181 [Picochlorum sp. BPE23]